MGAHRSHLDDDLGEQGHLGTQRLDLGGRRGGGRWHLGPGAAPGRAQGAHCGSPAAGGSSVSRYSYSAWTSAAWAPRLSRTVLAFARWPCPMNLPSSAIASRRARIPAAGTCAWSSWVPAVVVRAGAMSVPLSG